MWMQKELKTNLRKAVNSVSHEHLIFGTTDTLFETVCLQHVLSYPHDLYDNFLLKSCLPIFTMIISVSNTCSGVTSSKLCYNLAITSFVSVRPGAQPELLYF